MEENKFGHRIMYPQVVVCVIFVFLLDGEPAFTQSQKGVIARVTSDSDNSLTRDLEEHIPGHKLHTKLFDATSDFPKGRQKRALISFGRWATKFLLRGARLVKSTAVKDTYIKQGGYKRALEDFDSLKPVNVGKIGVLTRGEVGDKKLMVVPPYDNLPPFIMIIPKHNYIDGGDFFKRKVILYGNYEDVIKYLK